MIPLGPRFFPLMPANASETLVECPDELWRRDHGGALRGCGDPKGQNQGNESHSRPIRSFQQQSAARRQPRGVERANQVGKSNYAREQDENVPVQEKKNSVQ